MAFTGNFICNSFKEQLFEGVHTFGPAGDQFKLALYDNNATFTAATTAYTSANEMPASGSYVAGGGNLTSLEPVVSSGIVLISFVDLLFTGVDFGPFGALIYNSSVAGNPAVCVIDFDGEKSAVNQNMEIRFPPVTSTSAFLRFR
jgi:hypothetical protein